jgi:putative component of membrane protein insertase Oxa1/YidC/SpoIIIJ protein YidD
MLSTSLDAFTRRTAINSIEFYQQHISPQKGFSCPNRILYGEKSCSEYVKNLLLRPDLTSVVQMSVQRFRSCSLAAQELRSKSQGGCIVIPCCIPL